ncbi:ribonuclease H-like domain-containing protein [Tanacetum coccineum]|uniref:Ribonuclease H-like domain-containing protein n=1 Tax=Tanacetum coccineum TaxID=301880 RepID=A0ABQ5DV05_9ASTR
MYVHNFIHNYDDDDDYVEDHITLICRLDISDPLHLHPNDSIALTVVSIKLKGTENYQVWSCAMLLALEGKNKIGFIDGSCRRSNTYEVLGKVEVLLWSVRTVGLMVILLVCFKIVGYPTDFGKNKSGQNFKGKNVSNNDSVGSTSSSEFTDEQMATLISLIKYNKIGKNVQVNMAFCNGKFVDSMANQHMTYTDKELDNVLDISHLKIKAGHSNGTKAFIFKIKNLKLSNGLILYVVLVILEYRVTLFSVHNLVRENKSIVAFNESRCYFKYSGDWILLLKNDTSNVLQDINHVNFFDIEYPEMPYDDESVDPNLNCDKKSKSDSSHSSVPGGDVNTVDFPNNFGNDVDSSDDIFVA